MILIGIVLFLFTSNGWSQAFSTSPVRQRFDHLSAQLVQADSSYLGFKDSTLATSGKRIIGGSLLDPKFAEDYAAFRAREQNRSIYKASRGDSGNVWPTVWAASITTASDSAIIWDVLRSKIFLVILKQASGACGNNNFNDVHFLDGVLRIATAGGVCEGRYLDDGFFLYSTSGIGEYQGTWNQRNAGLATLTLNSSPAIVNNTVASVSAIRDPGGKRDASGRLAQKWGAITAGGGSIFDTYLNGIYDSSDTQSWLWGAMLSKGSWIAATSDATRDDVQWHYSGFSKTADAFANNEGWDNNSSSGEDLAWGNAAVLSRIDAIEGASVAGTNAPRIIAGADSGLYVLDAKANDNTNGVKILIEDGFNGPPEFGNTVGAWDLGATFSTGSSAEDTSPYNNRLVARAGTHNRITAVVGRGDSLTANGVWLRLSDTDFNYGTGDIVYSIWFKSHSATNPAAEVILIGGYTNPDAIRIQCELDGTLTWRVTGDNGATNDNITTTVDVWDGNWHHALAQKVGVIKTEFFIDGELVGTDASLASTQSLDPSEIKIAADIDLASGYFAGSINDVMVGKKALNLEQIRRLYHRGLAAHQSTIDPDDGLHNTDVDYVQANDNGQWLAGRTDSVTIFDSYGIPQRRLGTPNGNLQDAGFLNYGSDSLGVMLVTTTRTQFIMPDGKLADMALYRWPFVQSRIGERVVVDSAGIGGIFWTFDDAIDAAANADRSNILGLDGTYPQFDADQANQTIEGESWDTVIDGANADDAVDLSVTQVTLRNLSLKTTSNGSGGFHALNVTSNGSYTHLDHLNFPSSDANGVYGVNGATGLRAVNCYFAATIDGQSIVLDGPDNAIISNNYLDDCAGAYGIGGGNNGTNNILIIGNHINVTATSILFDSSDNFVTVVGNVTNGTITNNSTSGVTSGNATY